MNFAVSARSQERIASLPPGQLSTKPAAARLSPAAAADSMSSFSAPGAGLLESPAWMAVRAALLEAVRPYPEARAALIEAIQQALGGKGAVHAFG
jgi:hypothetical protein